MTTSPLRLAQVVVVHDGLERGERAARRVVVQVVQVQHRPGLIEQEPEREFLRVLTSPRHEVDVRRSTMLAVTRMNLRTNSGAYCSAYADGIRSGAKPSANSSAGAFNTNSSRAPSGWAPSQWHATPTVIPSGPSMPSN
ncbi:hypothetical protein [Streptodolium elevatio]